MMTTLLCLVFFLLGWRFGVFLDGYRSMRKNRSGRWSAVLVGLLMALHIGIGVQ